MFAKLLKHEWRASAGTLGILSLAALGAGVVGAVILRLMDRTPSAMAETEDGMIMVNVALGATLAFLALAVAVYVFATEILLLVRFYKNKFTDEGYLTFTLPVNTHQIFLSALVNFILWTVIAGCVATVSVLIALLFGTGGDKLINTDIFSGIKELVLNISGYYSWMPGYEDMLPRIIFQIAVQAVVGVIYAPVFMMTCITVGATIAKRHKILMAFGIYYGVNMIISIVTAVVTAATEIAYYSQNHSVEPVYMNFGEEVQVVLQIVLLVGGYFLSTYLMRRKLNLP